MNGKYLYDVFQYCGKNKLPDLTIALAMMSYDYPIPDGTTYGEICAFIGYNYDILVNAYAKKDVDYFCKVVENIITAEGSKDTIESK